MLLERGVRPKDIYVWEDTQKGINLIKHRGVNLVQDLSTLTMHFNVIIGNPPYSDRSIASGSGGGGTGRDLDSQFFIDSMKISNDVRLIIRAKHFTDKSSRFKKLLFKSGLKSIRYLSPDTFPSVLNTMTCVVHWQSDYQGPTKITFKDGTIVDRQLKPDDLVKLDNPNYVGTIPNNLSHRFVSGKLIRRSIVDVEGGVPMIEICGSGDEPVTRYIESGVEETGRNTHGVVMNYSACWGSLGRLFVKPYTSSISNSVVMLKTDTEEQAHQLLAYLQSEDIKQRVKDNMLSFHPTKTLFSCLPDVRF